MSETHTNTETPATETAGQEPRVETFSREYVEGLRQEAAKYRNEKKDAVEAAKTETRAEVIAEYEPQLTQRDQRISELESDLTAANLELLKIKTVLAAEIPSEDVLNVVSLVNGHDEETVSESVKRVKALMNKAPASQPPVDHTQGTGAGVPPLNGDKVLRLLEEAVGAKPRRRR